jgi:hypothetical protein
MEAMLAWMFLNRRTLTWYREAMERSGASSMEEVA